VKGVNIMTEDTIKMLKAIKRNTLNNIETNNKIGDWLEAEAWKTMLFAVNKIEEYEDMMFDN